MQTQTEESVVTQKTRELCQVILSQPEVQAMRQRIETFMANDDVRTQYDNLMIKGQALQQKQQSGMPLDGGEINDFEQARDKFVNNPVAKNFLDAQEEMQKLQESVGRYVAKSFEPGRVPEANEIESGSCGSGCGCH